MRHNGQTAKNRANTFQSTHSLRSATAGQSAAQVDLGFQSTHSLRSATVGWNNGLHVITVSIHALLAECDRCSHVPGLAGTRFNPRTPCGVRRGASPLHRQTRVFQSTHSLRSATWTAFLHAVREKVSIHALLAECDGCRPPSWRCDTGFNPRTPCGVRQCRTETGEDRDGFQSTHSLRSATRTLLRRQFLRMVSIHALLAECDPSRDFQGTLKNGFNPRTPCGVRPNGAGAEGLDELFQSTHSLRSATWSYEAMSDTCNKFQSTHSLRSATKAEKGISFGITVSIHALLAECDRPPRRRLLIPWCFNPRTPCGVRQLRAFGVMILEQFQSTHSLRSATYIVQCLKP